MDKQINKLSYSQEVEEAINEGRKVDWQNFVMDGYESPITLLQQEVSNIKNKVDKELRNGIARAVTKYAVDINEEELIRALNYDREQYTKGYADALTTLREKCLEHQDFHKGDDGKFRGYISIEDLDRIVDELEVRS